MRQRFWLILTDSPHVPVGFIKDQIKITYAVKPPRMMIRGERPLGNNVVSRFSKEFPIPENCKFNEMRAKFDQRGVLTVSMPKKAVTPEIARPKAAAAAKGQKPQSGAAPRLEKAGTDRTAPPPKTQEEKLSPPSGNTATSAVGKEPEMKTDEKVTDPTAGPKAPAITETKTQKGEPDSSVPNLVHYSIENCLVLEMSYPFWTYDKQMIKFHSLSILSTTRAG